MQYDFPEQIYKKAETSVEEKKQLIPLVFWFHFLQEKARNEGLLVLEDYIESSGEELLKIGIDQVVSGVDPVNLERRLLTRLYTTDCSGIDLLKRMIIIVGVLKIQVGDYESPSHPSISSLLGAEIEDIMESEKEKTIGSLRKQLLEMDGYMEFEELNGLYDYQARRVLSSAFPEEVLALLRVGTRKVREKILENLDDLHLYIYLNLFFYKRPGETVKSDFLFAKEELLKHIEND